MKKYLMASLFLLPLSASLFGEQKSAIGNQIETKSPSSLRLKMIEEVLADYHSGLYHAFLKHADEEFQHAQKAWKTHFLLEERKQISKLPHEHPVNKNKAFKQKMALLQEEQDRELLDIALNDPDEKISREIRDMIFFPQARRNSRALNLYMPLA